MSAGSPARRGAHVAEWPDFRPSRILAELAGGSVEFVVIGGYAAIAHGSSRLTNDLDITYSPEPANLEALGSVLVALEARLRGIGDDVPFVADGRALRQVELLTLDTRHGPLDLLAAPGGGPGWAALRRDAVDVDLDGITVPVASLDHLRAMKRAAGRPQDLLDIDELDAIERLSPDG
jgi:hypothetical protein